MEGEMMIALYCVATTLAILGFSAGSYQTHIFLTEHYAERYDVFVGAICAVAAFWLTTHLLANATGGRVRAQLKDPGSNTPARQ